MADFSYIDIHSHLNLPQFDEDREEVIARLREQSIGTITVGIDAQSSEFAVQLAGEHDHLWAIVGHHPGNVDEELFDENLYRKLLLHPRVVGVGECGFDYFRIEKTPEHLHRQEQLFRAQIELAIEYDKPLMLHIRPSRDSYDAYDDALRVLAEYKESAGEKLRGDAHFFAGTVEQAQKFVELGFMISFTGVVTFAEEYHEIIRALPIESIMCETDAPYAAPVPFRGQRCLPEHVIEVYKTISDIHGYDCRQQLVDNALHFFNLSS